MLLEAPETTNDELAVSSSGGVLVGPVLVVGYDINGVAEYNSTVPFLMSIRNAAFLLAK